MWHHVVARLDTWRHFLANACSVNTWAGNVPPDVILLIIVLVTVWLRVLGKDRHAGKPWRQILRDEWRATAHQLEGAEEAIAAEVVDEMKEKP